MHRPHLSVWLRKGFELEGLVVVANEPMGHKAGEEAASHASPMVVPSFTPQHTRCRERMHGDKKGFLSGKAMASFALLTRCQTFVWLD
jgi:hypothetical protein